MKQRAHKEVNGVMVKAMTLTETYQLFERMAEETKKKDEESGLKQSNITQIFLNCPGLTFNKDNINTMTTFELWEVWQDFARLNPPFRILNSYYSTLLSTPITEVVKLFNQYIDTKK
jgi:hypothetical protein